MNKRSISASERKKVHFLAAHFRLPGQLMGGDLVTGERHESMMLHNPEAFFRSHVVGPAGPAEPQFFDVHEEDETRTTKFTYLRSWVMPVAAEDRTSHVSIRFRTSNSLVPGDHILAAYHALVGASLSPMLERSTIIGDWVIWVFFEGPVTRAYAESVAQQMEQVLALAEVSETAFVMPVLHAADVRLPLPFPFFGGKFFGTMQTLDVDNCLVDWLSDAKANQAAKVQECTHMINESALADFLEAWKVVHGGRWMRAGALLPTAMEVGFVTCAGGGVDRDGHTLAILLGKWLTATHAAPALVESRKSGNSTKFRYLAGGLCDGHNHAGKVE